MIANQEAVPAQLPQLIDNEGRKCKAATLVYSNDGYVLLQVNNRIGTISSSSTDPELTNSGGNVDEKDNIAILEYLNNKKIAEGQHELFPEILSLLCRQFSAEQDDGIKATFALAALRELIEEIMDN